MNVVVAVLTVVVIVLSVLVVGLLRSHAEMLKAFNQLGVTFGDDGDNQRSTDSATQPRRQKTSKPAETQSPIPQRDPDSLQKLPDTIDGVTPEGADLAIALTGRAENTMLAFLTSGCSTCRSFWESFAAGIDLPRNVDRLVIVTKSPDEESPGALQNLAPRQHRTLMSSATWDLFDVPATPYFVLGEGSTGTIQGEGAATSWAQVASLLARVEADMEQSTEARIDSDLRRAGIEPGDPKLYPKSPDPER